MMSEHENILHQLLVKIVKEQCYEDSNITIKPIESDGSNYTSYLFLATISAAGKEDVNLFAKVAAIGEKMRDVNPIQIFKTETYFYKTLLQQYRKLENEYNVLESDKLRTPKFYASNDKFLEEVLVLENMVAKNFQVADRLKPMSSEYAFQGVKQLAKFHALSLAFATHHPRDFEITKKVLQVEEAGNTFLEFLKTMCGPVIEATEENKKELVTKFINRVLDKKDLKTLIKSSKIPIIIHGDYRGSNLMYKKQNNELEIAILDFQTLSIGNPIYDLLYFILNGADKNFLDNCYQSTLDRYYLELSAALTKLNVNPTKAYSKEDFDCELQQLLPLNLVLGFCTLLIVTVEAKEAPKADKELTLKDFAVTPNDIYKKRLNGIIDFFIDKGLIS